MEFGLELSWMCQQVSDWEKFWLVSFFIKGELSSMFESTPPPILISILSFNFQSSPKIMQESIIVQYTFGPTFSFSFCCSAHCIWKMLLSSVSVLHKYLIFSSNAIHNILISIFGHF